MSTIKVDNLHGPASKGGKIVMQGNDHLNVNGTFDFGTDSQIIVPQGTTDERPTSPTAGTIRFNTSIGQLEGYDGTDWVALTAAPPDVPVAAFDLGDGAAAITFSETLVFLMDSGGTLYSPNVVALGDMTTGSTSVAITEYNNIDGNLSGSENWRSLRFTSTDRPWVQHVFDRTRTSEFVLSSLANQKSNWTMPVNTSYTAVPAVGSSSNTQRLMYWEHNNNGSETHDIPTLAMGHHVWSNNMHWGQIDSTSNYGGLLNEAIYRHSGSGGGNTGDTLLVYASAFPIEDNPAEFTNYLTPTGPLGDATGFSWTYNGTTGLGGDPSYVADAADHTSSGQWQSQGFQQNGTDRYIEVDLGAGNEQDFQYTFAIGYANDSHWSNENYIEASNNGSSWTTVAEWKYHNGSRDGDGYLIYNTQGHKYSNTINNMTKWHPIVTGGVAYRYWRLRGTNFNASNNYMLCTNWALLQRNTPRTLERRGLVQDGLTIHLDAVDPNSFNGSGSTWFDLSGKGNHFDLEGSWSYHYNGTIRFSGGNARLPASRSVDVNSVDVGYTTFIGCQSQESGTSWFALFNNGDSAQYIDYWQRSGSRQFDENGGNVGTEEFGDMYELGFAHYAHATNRDTRDDFFWVNGDSWAKSGNQDTRAAKSSTLDLCIARRPDPTAYQMDVDVRYVVWYNRVLSTAEVKQNLDYLMNR